MIGLAIIEYDLPYSFVEYRIIREAFQYANSNIEFWSRNIAAVDCLKIYKKEKLKLGKMLDEVSDKILSFYAFPPPHTGGGLLLDVSTRWNSTHLMLSRAIMYKEALRHLAKIDTKMTNLISGSSYPTANLYFNQVWKIETWLKAQEYSYDDVICEMVKGMKEKFDKYWEDYSDILAIVAVFDPRLKFTYIEYCFNTLDVSTSKVRVDHLRKKLKKLFDVYKKNPTKTAGNSKSNSMEQNILPGYGGFYAFISKTVGANGKSALDKYLDKPVLDMMAFKSLDVLKYWKDNANRFQELSSMACDILSIPITTVASESSFSIGSRVLSKYRSSLLPSTVQALICARNWLRGFEEIVDPFEEGKEGEGEGE
ncbi:PREDICTED: zinc finger BED domain-containing protein DAYSLEEPER-like [Camelina sativa]|uniref:Zinc finger BED domain-containing protein DAYSLEEPER-like n=1 Tax=Camelina sativa TaxID=90675 RepID=A0ABM0XER1_CAMSA|nr:PREDICTED: zinc finger BED domain-containing protein DAYSLEEPER-like [Camelina sativa]